MRVLWLNKFDYSGNTEAVLTWAEGVLKRGIKLYLVLNGIPAALLSVYQDYMEKRGLKYSVNISTQQVQNLLYYQGCDLLHVFHPELFALAGSLSSSRKIPWIATCFERVTNEIVPYLLKASYITCSDSITFKEVGKYFFPYRKEKLILMPPGVKIIPADFYPLEKLQILYIGPLENKHIDPFLSLSNAAEKINSCTLDVISPRQKIAFNGNIYHWMPDFSYIAKPYNIIASFGYFLLQGIAMGKIALILEDKYEGLFSRQFPIQVPTFRPRPETENVNVYLQLKNHLQELLNNPSATKKLQQENWNYAKENHNLEIIGEKIARLYHRTLNSYKLT